jgi:hypothetical protein
MHNANAAICFYLYFCKKDKIMANGTLKLSLTYDQIISLVMQLPPGEKIKLGQELAKEAIDVKLTRLLNVFKTNEISEELIRKEAEIVRAELYAGKKGK